MGIIDEGLALYRNDKRRAAVQWFRRHGAVAATAVGAQRAGQAAWRGTYSGVARGRDAIRESIEVLRGEQEIHTPDPIRRAGDVRGDAARAAHSTDSPSGRALAIAAGLLAEEAETVLGAAATVETVSGITTGMTTYAHAVAHLAETVRARQGDQRTVRAIDDAAHAVETAAEELQRAMRVIADMYASQVEQEDQTGTTLK